MQLIKGITYDKENVESLDDAREQHSNAKAISGNYATNGYMIYSEYENGLSAIASGTKVQVNNFFGMVQGRMCKLEAPTKIDVVLGGNGTILLTLDLSQAENTQIYLESTLSTSFTQNDCLNDGKKFQAPIFTYTSTTTAVTGVNPVPNVAVGGDFQEKLNVTNPQEIQGDVTINTGSATRVLTLKSDSEIKEIGIYDTDNNKKASVRYGDEIGIYNYSAGGQGANGYAQIKDDGLYHNSKRLLKEVEAFTQSDADNRYWRSQQGLGFKEYDLTKVGNTLSDDNADDYYISSYYNTNNAQAKMRMMMLGNYLYWRLYALDASAMGGIRITDNGLDWTDTEGVNRACALEINSILRTGDQTKNGKLKFDGEARAIEVTNPTDGAQTSPILVMNRDGERISSYAYTGSTANAAAVYLTGYQNATGVPQETAQIGARLNKDGAYIYTETAFKKLMTVEEVLEEKIDTLQEQVTLAEELGATKSTKSLNTKLEQTKARLQAHLDELALDYDADKQNQIQENVRAEMRAREAKLTEELEQKRLEAEREAEAKAIAEYQAIEWQQREAERLASINKETK